MFEKIYQSMEHHIKLSIGETGKTIMQQERKNFDETD